MGGFQGLGDSYHHPEKYKNSMGYDYCVDKNELKKCYDKEYYDKNKEEILKQKQEWYKNNKEEILKKQKEWKKKNKEKYNLYQKHNYEKNKEQINKQQKEYNKTTSGIKRTIINNWKHMGLKLFGYTYDEVYEYYLSIDNCEVCSKDISMGGINKHMDHCHLTGIFRWVLCCRCNNHDNWMKYFN